MNITETRNENVVQLVVEGRIDTNTSPQLQASILQAFQKRKALVIDFEKVDYISSAGLRALLIGQKTANSKGGTMTLYHVGDAVMKILNMSGFSRIFTIE